MNIHSVTPQGNAMKSEATTVKNYCSLYAMSLYSDADSLTAFQASLESHRQKAEPGKIMHPVQKARRLGVGPDCRASSRNHRGRLCRFLR
ncbi:hypothetical protein [Rhodopirellula bahusiensis]|uniref:hypothetical protein n=2 Tax=Rhodopirellula bahusiensis TaxID=2014065 RepID=UPI003267BF0C